jgi:hypothetical protein
MARKESASKEQCQQQLTTDGRCKHRSFGGKYRLKHQGEKNRRARNNVGSN